MLVTIVIPCYNQGSLIEETLLSVYKQEYLNWECLIIDDGSTDNSSDIIKKWVDKDSRFFYFYKENGGLSSARNFGIIKANGEFLQFLDSDDLIDVKKLKCDVDMFLNSPEVDIVYSFPRFFREFNKEENYYQKFKEGVLSSSSFDKFEILNSIIYHNFTVVSSPLVKKDIVLQVGFFDESLKSNEDWDYWLRCAIKGAIIKFRENIKSETLIRVLQVSMSTNTRRMLSSEIQLYEKTLNFLRTHTVPFKKQRIIKDLSVLLLLKKVQMRGMFVNYKEILEMLRNSNSKFNLTLNVLKKHLIFIKFK